MDKIRYKGDSRYSHAHGCIESSSIGDTQRSQHMEITHFACIIER